MSKRPRFWFLIWVLPAITLGWTYTRLPLERNSIRDESYTQGLPVTLNISCDMYFKGKQGVVTQASNLGHYEIFDASGLPAASDFAPAPLFCDGNIATGYPIEGHGPRFMPAAYVLYSSPVNQTATRITFDWTSTSSVNGLRCCYYYSDNGVDWITPSHQPEAATGKSGTITLNITSTAKHHMIAMTYDGRPSTLAITEVRLHD